MIKVTYENEETGQKMIVTFKSGDQLDRVEVAIDFEPSISDDTEDTFGIMQKLFDCFGG